MRRRRLASAPARSPAARALSERLGGAAVDGGDDDETLVLSAALASGTRPKAGAEIEDEPRGRSSG